MGKLKLVSFAIGALAVVLGANEYFAMHRGPECSNVSFDEASKLISKDFLGDRMLRWQQESDRLGTKSPKLSFDQKNTKVTEVYLVPFTAEGPNGIIHYDAMYTCKTNSIEYSSR
jgi:hypothetical protein